MGLSAASQARDLFSSRGDVLIEVRSIVVERSLQPIGERRRGTPTKRRRDLGRIGEKVTNVDRLLLRWPGYAARASTLRDSNHELHEIAMSNGFETTDVEHVAVHHVAGARPEKRVHRIVDVDEIAKLRPVAVDLNFPVLEYETDEPTDEPLATVLDQLARAIHVREPQ